jgi:hypothetical protein
LSTNICLLCCAGAVATQPTGSPILPGKSRQYSTTIELLYLVVPAPSIAVRSKDSNPIIQFYYKLRKRDLSNTHTHYGSIVL